MARHRRSTWPVDMIVVSIRANLQSYFQHLSINYYRNYGVAFLCISCDLSCECFVRGSGRDTWGYNRGHDS